ncbi:lipase family protein [Niabella ginsengisoli]|uniref:Lipase family protein n=1 Tax=Niabella ginsengisoli TaxID=522298 RepID=A0ABS9SFE1_9BACT|nr:lipase family protein [Niabella ginsengisoli]MCH5597065.1 lipase family protein [Niabella ginsengisoli]
MAFKGSITKWDWWEDFKVEFTPFPFFNHGNIDHNLLVEQGFKDIYATKISEQQNSLQYQLIDFLQKNNPEQLLIAAHSLGSALAEMFTYDILKSRGIIIPSSIVHINYACPKVYNNQAASDFRSLLESKNQYAVLRIVNKHDIVPNLPIIGEEQDPYYYHATDYFLIDFWEKDEWVDTNYYVYHSMVNYQNVINKINMTLPISNPQEGQTWGIDFWGNRIILNYEVPNKETKECDGKSGSSITKNIDN